MPTNISAYGACTGAGGWGLVHGTHLEQLARRLLAEDEALAAVGAYVERRIALAMAKLADVQRARVDVEGRGEVGAQGVCVEVVAGAQGDRPGDIAAQAKPQDMLELPQRPGGILDLDRPHPCTRVPHPAFSV
jgi:hypothetical protein